MRVRQVNLLAFANGAEARLVDELRDDGYASLLLVADDNPLGGRGGEAPAEPRMLMCVHQ